MCSERCVCSNLAINASSILLMGSGQTQWQEMRRYGLDLLVNPAKVSPLIRSLLTPLIRSLLPFRMLYFQGTAGTLNTLIVRARSYLSASTSPGS